MHSPFNLRFTSQTGFWQDYPSGSGLSIKYADPTLKNLIVRGNSGGAGAISVHGPSQSIIQNVLVHENDTQGIFSWFSAPIIMNSTIVNNVYNGVYTYPGGSPTLVNSIITNNGENNVFLSEQSDSPGQVSIAYSMVGGGQEGVVLNNGTLDWGPGNINTDPQFLDEENDDYHLSDISPCIGSATASITIGGTDYHSPASDLDGSSRPNPSGTNPDMGAYESDRGVDPDYNGPLWYVDGSANLPYGNGGPGAPFNSIGGALESATDGDTILVSNGTYEEDVRFYSKAVALIGEDRDSTIISAGENGYAFYLDQAGKPNTLIRNFTITNGAVENSNAGLYITDNSPDCKLENLNIVGNNGDGVYIAGFSSAKFTNCNISDNGLNGIVVWSESSVELVNTTFAKNGHYGIRMQGDLAPKSITVSNSIFYDNSSASIRSDNGITDIVNVAYTYSDDAFEQISSVVTFNSENLYDSSVNVKFVEEEVGNYHLVASSFLVNGGHPDSTDANGTRADLGAFPYDSPDLDTWYVSVAGNDTSGIGNAEFPLSSIQAALNLADNGDSIFVSGGTFQENLVVRGKNLVVSGSGEEETVIDANFSGTGIVVTGLEDFNFNFGSIENFKLRGASIINGTGMQNWTVPDGDDTPFGGGAYVFQTSMAEFHNVSFSNNSAYGGGAIAAQDASVTLNNVIMHSNSSTYRGSAIWQLAGNIILTNSLIYKNSYVGDQSDFSNAASALAFGSGRYKLINNTIANNHGYPIHAYAQDPRVLLANSILTWHDGQGSRPYFTPSDAVNVYLFNNFIKSGINIGGVFNENTNVFSTSNYYFEPSFVDTSSGNYRLSDQSVAISSGRNSIQEGFFNYPSGVEDFFFYEVTDTDLEGNDRINPPNSKVDIGAYENSNGVASYQNRKWNVSAERVYGNGSPDLPFPTINHALDAISEFGGDTILVQDGTYHESIYTYGPNGYDHLTIKSVNGPASTIIDAPSADQGNCLTVDGSNITVDGFTLTGGEGYQGAGGMIKESPTLKNLIVTDNHAGHRGGGLLIHGSATLENVEVFNNSSNIEDGFGGGIHVNDLTTAGGPTFINVQVHGNSSWKGGGMFVQNSNVTISLSAFNSNVSNIDGGGFHFDNSAGQITKTSIMNNNASNRGGGIYSFSSTIHLDRVNLYNNSAQDVGGGLAIINSSSPTIVNSIFYENKKSDNELNQIFTELGDNSNLSIQYSNLQGGTGNIVNYGGWSISDQGINTSEPRFISPETNNFNLTPDSRLIDAGHPDSLDSDGTRSDIGAYFYDQAGLPLRAQNLKTFQNNQRVELTWDMENESEVSFYNVYRSFDANENWYSATPYSTTNSPIYVESSPAPDQTYFYRVSAVDSDGDEGLLGFMEHHRLCVDSTSILLKEFDATVDLDQLIIPGDVQYTLEGFFKYTNDESPEDLFGFQTELILKKSVEGDSIRLSLDLPQVQESSDESELFHMVDTSSWHHVAIVGNEENTVVWIDGTPAMTTTYLVYGGTFSFSSGQQIDELRFSYSALYDQPFVPVAGFGVDETTFGYWRMNEGSLDSEFPALYDISGNSNHIVLVERTGELNESGYMEDVPHRNDIENAITINEVMPNPSGSDGGKEWLEVYNGWFTPIHLGGWTLEGGSTTESHVVDGNVKIPSGGYSLLGQSSDVESNGGYDPDYEYGTTISLSNFGEALSIKDGSGQIMDAVDFDDTFPFSSGASMELIRPDYDNSLADSWLAAGLPYGESGNMGTPGERNAAFSGTFLLASAALDYGYVTEGTESELSFWILNNGVADLVIDSMMNQTEYFTLTPTSGIVPPGDSLEVSVTFSPETVGVYFDTVMVYTDDPYNPVRHVSFLGNSINEFADIVVNGAGNDSLAIYQFPFTRLGFSRTLNLDIVNIGTPDLEIEEIILEGDSEFSIDVDASILSFLDTLSMSVVYEPSEEGSNTATLIFGSNDPDEPSYTMSLFGQAAENIILFVPSEYPTIAAAIDSAYQQDTIEVAPGTYSGGLSLLDKNLVFRGGGDPGETMLQGDGAGPVLTIDGGQSAVTKISNVTILGGGGTQGGGIRIDGGANPSLDHVIIAANAASGSGGGIAVLSGGADMSNMTIANNSSVGSGGAVYAAVGASVTIDNSILFGNGSTEIGSFGNVNTTYSIVSGGVDGEGNMDVDPLFINGPALDFSLSWESMAIDAGDPDEFPDDDGTTLDIGALPYDQTLQPPDAVTSFAGLGGNGQIELQWGYPLDPRGNANGDIVDFVLMRAVASGSYDSLAVLNDTDSMYTDTGQDGHLVNGQEYHYIVVPRDTSNLESPANDTLTIIPIGGSIALMDSDTTNDFGSVDHDQTSVWELLIENTGNGNLTLSSIQVTSERYSVSEDSMVIPAFTTDTLLVTFDPDLTSGLLLDTLVITTDDLDAPTVEVELSGTSSWPVLVLSEEELDHGDVRVDLVETLVLDISNSGTDTLFIDSVFVQDTLSGFSVAISEGRTSSRIADILHSFLSKQDDNYVTVNQGGVENQDSTKSSGGRGGEIIQGSRDIGTNPEEDLGTRPMPGGLMGSVQSDGGKQLANDRNNQSRIHLSVEVMPGESIGLDVSFSRPDTATVSTSLEITSDDPLGNGDLSIPLNGHSVAPVLFLSSESHLFGNVLDSMDYVFTITNTGTDTLNISEIDIPLAAFSQIWEGPTATVLEPGASGELTVTFSPELGGYYEENLTILSDTYLTGNSVIGLSGLKIPTQNIDFSGVLLGEDSVQVLSFENNGNVDLTIATISVESSSDFSTDISTNLVLPVDAAGQLNVTFMPSARGPATGNIIFTTPASPNEIVAVSATGEGWIPPTAEFAATSISVVTNQGNDLSFDLEVTNSGDYPLNYASSVSADFAGWVWLETVSTGQILGTTDSTILVNVVNTANLDPGIYNGNIYFDTNTGENPSELVSGTHVMDIFLNLLGDDSQITDTTVTIPSGNTPPITFTDENGESIGLVLDFVNSAGGTVTVQGVSTLPPVDENTPFVDPDGLVTDPVYPAQYYEISTDIEGNFVTDIGLSYSILPGIDSPNTLRLAKRPGNSGTSEPWQLIAVADTEVDTVTGQVVAKNQSSFSQWALISNSTDNSFMDTKGPTATSLTLNPVEPGVLMDAQVSVDVSDDTGIESVTLFFAPGGSDSYSSTAMVNDGQGTFSGTIPGSSVTQSGLLYYVMSQDVLGFSSSSDTLGAAVNFASGTLTTNSASGSAYPTGLPMDAWRLISTPAVLNETGLTQVFDELGMQDNTVWRVFRYDDVSSTYKDNPVDLNSTESYWIYQKTEDNLTMDTPAGKTGDMAGTEITLKTGWNFIGSPYPFQVPLQLDQVQFYGPLTYGISGESWSPVVTELDPWNGYVVYNRMSTDQIITLDPSIGSGTTIARKVEESGWLVSLDLSSGTHGDHINTLGALETAEDAIEWHDNPEIRSPGTGVSLFFKLEGEALELTSDIRSLGQQVNVWDMHVRSDTDSDVDLSWSVIQDLPSDVDIRLVDLSTRKVINMKSETQLFFGTLDARYDRRVKIVAGDKSDVAAKIGDVLSMIPEELSISGNFPNPFNPSTTIRYGLPEPRNVRMMIVNIKGQQIAELVSGWKDMGRHEVVWNGRNDDGSSLSSGIYFVVINDGTNFRTHKVMLLK